MSGRRPGRRTGRLLAPVALGSLSVACGIGLLATSGWLIARASQQPPVLALSIAIAAVQAFALGRGLARYLERLSVHAVALERLGRLRLSLYDTLEPLVPAAPGLEAGSMLTGFVTDVDLVATGQAKRTMATVDVCASVLLGGVVGSLVDPDVGAALVGGALAIVVTSVTLSRLGRRATAREAALRAQLARLVIETVDCSRELVAWGRRDLVEGHLRELQRLDTAAGRRRAVAAGLSNGGALVTSGAALIGVVGVSLLAHAHHRLSGVMLVATVLGSLAVLDHCASLPAALGDLEASRAAQGRLLALDALVPLALEPDGGLEPSPVGRDGALERVEVRRGRKPVLRDVSVELPPGGRVALVGPSGAGKTTALYAFLRFVACSRGRALLGGVDVALLSRAALARGLGWVPDRTHLFCATVRDNLRLGRPAASDDECLGALDRVGLRSWFDDLDDGLDTPLGADGRTVSAGERQRLGLARVFLAGSPVLLLDEPTAHIDPAAAPTTMAELLGATGDRSVLVVTHEPWIAEHVDHVVDLARHAPTEA